MIEESLDVLSAVEPQRLLGQIQVQPSADRENSAEISVGRKFYAFISSRVSFWREVAITNVIGNGERPLALPRCQNWGNDGLSKDPYEDYDSSSFQLHFSSLSGFKVVLCDSF
jgi:hypothetical protein